MMGYDVQSCAHETLTPSEQKWTIFSLGGTTAVATQWPGAVVEVAVEVVVK